MSEITVKAVQPVHGLPPEGAVVTVEHTPRVEAAIRSGHLVVVDESGDTERDADEQAAAALESTDTAATTKIVDDFVEPGDDD